MTHRGPHIVRPFRPHKLVIIIIIIIIKYKQPSNKIEHATNYHEVALRERKMTVRPDK